MKTDLTVRIAKRLLWVAPVVAAGSALLDPGRYPAAIVLGALVGLLHLHGVRLTSRAVAGGVQATGFLWFFSIFRLLFVLVTLAALVKYARVDILGLLCGLMIVHALVLVEGWRDARDSEDNTDPSAGAA